MYQSADQEELRKLYKMQRAVKHPEINDTESVTLRMRKQLDSIIGRKYENVADVIEITNYDTGEKLYVQTKKGKNNV